MGGGNIVDGAAMPFLKDWVILKNTHIYDYYWFWECFLLLQNYSCSWGSSLAIHHTAQQNFIVVNLCRQEKNEAEQIFYQHLSNNYSTKCEDFVKRFDSLLWKRKKNYPSAFVSVIICILILKKMSLSQDIDVLKKP